MKSVICILIAILLLCGCTPAAQLSTTDPIQTQTVPTTQAPSMFPTTVPTTVPTEPPETQPTEPPDPIMELLESMTLEEKVGQIFIARCPDSGALEDIAQYHLGGFVLFARDFEGETKESVADTIAAYQAASTIPMLIAVDEEGGTVTRVSRYPAFRSERFSSPRTLFSKGGLDLIASTETEKCQLLASLGINVNLGPVCDITTNSKAFMYKRSLGQSPEITAEFIQTVVQIMADHGIGSALKHFPGYGNNTDTHVAIAVDDRPLSDLEAVDLVPFAAGIGAGCDAIMVSHVYINAIDPEIPATLSPAVHAYLRDSMGFEGVILTDDLSMAAITDIYGAGEAAVLAVLAGNDLLCVTDYPTQYEAVLQAVKDGRISEQMLNNAVIRILRWKAELGLIA